MSYLRFWELRDTVPCSIGGFFLPRSARPTFFLSYSWHNSDLSNSWAVIILSPYFQVLSTLGFYFTYNSHSSTNFPQFFHFILPRGSPPLRSSRNLRSLYLLRSLEILTSCFWSHPDTIAPSSDVFSRLEASLTLRFLIALNSLGAPGIPFFRILFAYKVVWQRLFSYSKSPTATRVLPVQILKWYTPLADWITMLPDLH